MVWSKGGVGVVGAYYGIPRENITDNQKNTARSFLKGLPSLNLGSALHPEWMPYLCDGAKERLDKLRDFLLSMQKSSSSSSSSYLSFHLGSNLEFAHRDTTGVAYAAATSISDRKRTLVIKGCWEE